MWLMLFLVNINRCLANLLIWISLNFLLAETWKKIVKMPCRVVYRLRLLKVSPNILVSIHLLVDLRSKSLISCKTEFGRNLRVGRRAICLLLEEKF